MRCWICSDAVPVAPGSVWLVSPSVRLQNLAATDFLAWASADLLSGALARWTERPARLRASPIAHWTAALTDAAGMLTIGFAAEREARLCPALVAGDAPALATPIAAGTMVATSAAARI